MKTATFIGIDSDPKSSIVYADARVLGSCQCRAGELISGIGFTFEGGKFDAMWDLAQRLSEHEIEVEATA